MSEHQLPRGAEMTTLRIFCAPLGFAMAEALRVTLHVKRADLDAPLSTDRMTAALRELQGAH